MNKVFFSIIFVFVVLGGLAIFQATRTNSDTVMIPSQVAAEKSPEKLLRLRVGGKVAGVTSYTLEPKIELQFTVQDPGKEGVPLDPSAVTIPVIYNSLKPDMFTVGRDVIIEGSYVNGVFRANKLLTQCPSKYEPPSPDSQYEKGKS